MIEAFAQFLRSTTEASHATGRIGGEEFAIILPGTNLVAARLFAEGARSAFSTISVEGLPADLRFTASFGVAELTTGEAISGLMRRADAALYEAKNAGRDCVRVSKPVGAAPARELTSRTSGGRRSQVRADSHPEGRTCSCGP